MTSFNITIRKSFHNKVCLTQGRYLNKKLYMYIEQWYTEYHIRVDCVLLQRNLLVKVGTRAKLAAMKGRFYFLQNGILGAIACHFLVNKIFCPLVDFIV